MLGGTVRQILFHLFRHRVRTLLTIVGLVVGVFALSIVGSLVETLNAVVTLQEEATLATLRLRPANWEQPLTPATRRAVRRVPGVGCTLTRLWSRLEEPTEEGRSSQQAPERLWAMDSDVPGLEYGPPLVSGRLLKGRKPTSGATNEVLLDFELAQAHGWDTGDTIGIRGRPFVVAGILERPPLSTERNAYVDYQTLRTILRMPADYLSTLEVLPEPGKDATELAARIQELVPEVRVETPEQRMQQNRGSLGMLAGIASVSAGLALLAGTLTVVNTMLMSVRERQREIGLKKALGAGDGDILLEFLLESGMLGALAGGSAVLLTWLVGLGVNQFTRARLGMDLLSLTPRLLAGAVAFAILLGSLAGVYPAWRAARKDPVQALRDAPAAVHAERGPKRLLYLVARRARWLLTVGGISAGILILTVALSVAEFLNDFTQSAIEATRDRIGLHIWREPHMAFSTMLRQVERTDGVRGVVVSAYGGHLFERGEADFGWMGQVPQISGIDSPTGELGYGVPIRASIARGRFLAPDSLREVVLGPDLAESLGLDIGDVLAIHDRDFVVVGIWETSQHSFMTNFGLNAFITLAALQSLNPGQLLFPEVTALVAPGTNPEELAARLGENMPELVVQTSQSSAEEIRQVMAIFSLVLVGYVGLGLLAGGLSVVNTMFMAVTERTREIGLKKAVGASDGDILAEVVEESGWVGLLGGILGITAGWLVTVGVNAFTRGTIDSSLMLVTPRLVVAGLVFTTFLGMIAGTYPAWRASRLDPVQALRSE